jgi:hydrogenase assembly chaperone HypC/HupF
MCLTAPARVLAVEPDFAIVEAGSRRRRASNPLADELHPGDWVLIARGAVVRRVRPDQAEMTAHAFRTATGLDIDDDLEAERHHYPTEDRGEASARHHHPRTR